MGLISAAGDLLFGDGPEKIDPNTVYNMSKSPIQDELYNEAKSMMDPTTNPLYQAQQNMLTQNASDAAFNQNIISGRSNAANPNAVNPNQSAMQNEGFISKLFSGITDKMTSFGQGLYDRGTSLLQNVGSMDVNARQGMAQAYGQNITNQNNYDSAMASNAFSLGSTLLMSDVRKKKDIKKVGHIKLSNGKKAGMYTFKYRHNGKKSAGVLAQEIEGLKPNAVHKIKGIRYVDYKNL